MSSDPARGSSLLVVISGPAGAGKTVLSQMLLKACKNMTRSISCTTRARRGSEKNGIDYFFLTEEDFAERERRGEFLETAFVHDARYGTPRRRVEAALRSGKSVLLVIDVQGAAQIRKALSAEEGDAWLKDHFVDIFIKPPSLKALRERLMKRGENSQAEIERRMENARREMEEAHDYKYVVVNDDIHQALRKLKEIIEHESGEKA